jgi:hypothetical protein
VEFNEKLIGKLKGTHAKATSDPSYTTFLKNFGEFTVAKLEKKEVPGQQFILEELKALRSSIDMLSPTRTPVTALLPDHPLWEELSVTLTSTREIVEAETVGDVQPTLLGHLKHLDRIINHIRDRLYVRRSRYGTALIRD